jgi:hyperosmotically inducible periplasmic protein
MKVKNALGTVALCSLLSLAGQIPAFAQEERSPAADNTKVNQRDRSKTEPTADQGKNNASDRATMQKIRKALMDDKSLSSYAHNVKVIAQNGKVTLKGPVRSDEEMQAVEQKATEVAGSGNVTNELTVKAARSKTK